MYSVSVTEGNKENKENINEMVRFFLKSKIFRRYKAHIKYSQNILRYHLKNTSSKNFSNWIQCAPCRFLNLTMMK